MSGAVVTAKSANEGFVIEEGDKMQVESVVPGVREEEDLYSRLKVLQRQLEFLEIQVRNR